MKSLAQRVSEELLPFVRGPGQYVGGEVNSVARDWAAADVRIALAFPDTYAMGMSHLGCQILYDIANHIDGVACERVYAPWIDAERVMRANGIPLFTWDSRAPVASADIFAISLQYEMHFTNVLNLLDLAHLPLRSSDRLAVGPRARAFPLVIAGGPQADNPEPLADFIDLFVIGDGEDAIETIIREYRGQGSGARGRGEEGSDGGAKRDFLVHMARTYSWAYVPGLYEVRYNADGTVAGVEPKVAGLPPKIVRGHVADFENAPAPLAPLIPWTEAPHERVTVEIMRGCPRGCRFCHAGRTKRPVRWRSVDRIVELAEAAWRNSGFSELALTSLSTSDYPHLGELMGRLNSVFAPRRVSISVPSMRVTEQLKVIPWQVKNVRKSGLTIAAEAAGERMRRIINKDITDADLLAGVQAAYAAGWRSIKLYFMLGFPGETEADIRGIVELARRVADARRSVEPPPGERRPGPAAVTASVSPLVPKPHTPFQWLGQCDREYFMSARNLLRDLARRSPVSVKMHNVDRSLLEAVFARGDRRVGRVIESAWRCGARFDGWDDCFDAARWRDAFTSAGLDPAFYARRTRPFSEVLPWDHIESGAPRARLQAEAETVASIIAEQP